MIDPTHISIMRTGRRYQFQNNTYKFYHVYYMVVDLVYMSVSIFTPDQRCEMWKNKITIRSYTRYRDKIIRLRLYYNIFVLAYFFLEKIVFENILMSV